LSGMYIKWGDFQHEPGEANLISFEVRANHTERRQKLTHTVEAHVGGVICSRGGSAVDISNRLNQLQAALLVDDKDFGLYHADGTPTPHVIYTDDPLNLTGNQIVFYNFPANHNGEFTTGREFMYKVRAEYFAATSQMMMYKETITHHGDTGPLVNWVWHKYHEPTYRVTNWATTQIVTQHGMAQTIGTWLAPPPPVLPPPFELTHRRMIRRSSPLRFPKQKYIAYPIEWTYVYEVPDPLMLLPTMR
jgi:hypothetical protein